MPMSPRLLRPRAAAGGFDPRAISGLAGWWDFADLASLGPTASGTGAVSDNGPIKYAADKSGNGRHMTQSGADSVSPTLVVNGRNGRPVLLFDGGDSLRATFNLSLTSQSLFTVVFNNGSAQFARAFSQATNGGNDFDAGSYVPAIMTTTSAIGGLVQVTTVAPVSLTNATWVVYGAQHTGSQIQNRVNNGTASTASNTLNLAAAGFAIGTQVAGPAGGFWIGRIAETIMYNRSVSDAERNAIAQYLSQKWNITVS